MVAELPKIKDYKASNGAELRTLFAVAVLRALTPYERNAVFNTIFK